MKQRKRIAALLAAGVMLFSSLPANALGEERQTTGSLCEHHPAHTAECGYAEGTEGTPCNHQHTDECYTFVTNCVHEHGADCYPAEGVSDNAAAPSGAEMAEPTACTHQCSEESGCISKELDCKHEHNSECGYTPAAEGAPCTYVCPICPVQAQINALPTADELGNMTEEEQQAAYEKLQAAYDAYNALTDEQKAEITGAEIFDSLFAVFNGMVNTLAEEEFPSLTPGETYWFDLSDEGIPGTVNTGNDSYAVSVPDTTLTWVPFTYVGTINAYSRDEEGGSTEDNVIPYDHSLFIADYVVTHYVTWDNLDNNGMIFGTAYTSGGVTYKLRAPSVGSAATEWTGTYENECGIPESNEWDVILDKANQVYEDNTNGYIKNWYHISCWGQDTKVWNGVVDSSVRATRGYFAACAHALEDYNVPSQYWGFRPVLEIPDTLTSDSLSVVTVELNGGKIGNTGSSVNIVVKSNESFTAPSGDGLTAPEGMVFGSWLGSDGQTYEPGDAVPASVTTLTAQWAIPYISYYWDENAQELVRSDAKTTGPYTLLTADTAGTVGTNWPAGWYVVEGEVTLTSCATVTGEVHLILKDGCKLNANQGIQVGTGNSLTIYAQSEEESTMGFLTANGGNSYAGIGGSISTSSGTITINGGIVNATGGNYGAGIGGGDSGAGEGITINGGTVTARGGNGGAGIGGGDSGAGEDITINGGTITATGGGEVRASAGIGGGYDGAGENITINGGNVNATGGNGGAGIGGGYWGDGRNITISGGTVTATGRSYGAGIGGGGSGSENNITITNGSVKASSIRVPTDGNGHNVYLAKLEVQSGVNEVTLDSGTAPKTFTRAGDHPEGDAVDTAFYLYLTGEDHEITISNTKYKALWDADSKGFIIKLAVSAPTVMIDTSKTTASSITVTELENQDTYGEAEYRLDGKNWQPSNVLTDLHSNTTYTVYARYKGNETYAMSDAGKLENVSTSNASYTITIPTVTLEAGKADSSASISVDGEKSFDLGCNGRVDVTVKKGNSVTADGKLKLTRQDNTGNHTITSALLIDGTELGNIDDNVATFTMNNKAPVPVSFAKPTEPDIPAGTYSGTITFEVSYTEPTT